MSLTIPSTESTSKYYSLALQIVQVNTPVTDLSYTDRSGLFMKYQTVCAHYSTDSIPSNVQWDVFSSICLLFLLTVCVVCGWFGLLVVAHQLVTCRPISPWDQSMLPRSFRYPSETRPILSSQRGVREAAMTYCVSSSIGPCFHKVRDCALQSTGLCVHVCACTDYCDSDQM